MKKFTALLLCFMMVVGAAVIPATAYDGGEPPYQLPQVRIVTQDGNGTTLQKADGYVNAQITLTDTDGSQLSDAVLFKVRGNTTAMTSVKKKAYTFKFDKKKELLGMGKGKKWVLIANAFDPTQLRNYIAMSIAHHLDLAYASEQRFVEVWVDGSFRGLYTMMEPVQEGKDRVNIDIESNNGMTDFLVEYERWTDEEDVTYLTTNKLRFAIKEPEEPNEEQAAYVSGIMEDTVQTIINGTREEIEAKIDVESFVKYFLLNEFYKTYDFDATSVFYYYQNGKLHAGPPWDYDLSSGNTTVNQTRGKAAYYPDGVFADKQLFGYLYKYTWFQEEVRKAFCDNYLYLKSISAEDGLMDELLTTYADAITRNFTLTEWTYGKAWINIQKTPYKTYEENFDYLKTWLSDRCSWLRDHYGVYLTGDANGNFILEILDATKIQRLLANLEQDEDGKMTIRSKAGETLNIMDATAIQRYLAEYPVAAPIGEPALYR